MTDTARGKVSRIYADSSFTHIGLAGIAPEITPRDGYFRLDRTHSNYIALYSLIVVAAVNRYPITIRTEAEIAKLNYSDIGDILIDYEGAFGAIDPTFGGVLANGIVMTGVSSGNDYGRAVVAQPNDDVIVVGTVGDGYPDFGLARYQPQGLLTGSFRIFAAAGSSFRGGRSASIRW